MTADDLAARYRAYIACLNARDWDRLGDHVHPDAARNGTPLGLAGYRAMLEADVAAIPDLRFDITRLVVEPPHVAARLAFDCTPAGVLFGRPVNGRRVQFTENVFYRWHEGRIIEVLSVIDTAALDAQLAGDGAAGAADMDKSPRL